MQSQGFLFAEADTASSPMDTRGVLPRGRAAGKLSWPFSSS